MDQEPILTDVVLCNGAVVPHWDAAHHYCFLALLARMPPDGTNAIRFLRSVALLPTDAQPGTADLLLENDSVLRMGVETFFGRDRDSPDWERFFDEFGGMRPIAKAVVLASVRGSALLQPEVASPFTTERDEAITRVIKVRAELEDQFKHDKELGKLIWRHLDASGLTREDLVARDRRERRMRGPDDVPGPSRN